jgi:hypothetical protein
LAFTLPKLGVVAHGVTTDEGFLVLKGSTASVDHQASLQPGYVRLRKELKEKGALKEDSGKLVFTVDYLFSSASAASGVVAGTQRSGSISWKDKDGRTLRDIEAAMVEESPAAQGEDPT